jgi:signal transduction histidine kinase
LKVLPRFPAALSIRVWLLLAFVAVLVVPQVVVSLATGLDSWLTLSPIQVDLAREVQGNVARWGDPGWQEQLRPQLASARLDLALQDSAGSIVFRTADFPLPDPNLTLGNSAKLPADGLGGSAVSYIVTKHVAVQPAVRLRAPDPAAPVDNEVRPIVAIETLAGSKATLFGFDFVRGASSLVADVAGPVALDRAIVPQTFWIQSVTDDRGHRAYAYFVGPTDVSLLRLRTLLVPVTGFLTLGLTLLAVSWFLGRAILRPLAATSRAARLIAEGNLEFDLPQSRVREVAEVGVAFRAMGDALGASLGRQSELEQERRLFVGAIAHDLRTPLFCLRGYLDGLASGLADTPDKRSRYLAVCQEKVASLDHLIAELFTYAQVDYQEQALRSDCLDLGTLIGRAVDSFRVLASAKHLGLEVTDASEPIWVVGDEHLLARAVDNLLDNAFRYAPEGGRVQVDLHLEQDHVVLHVRDSGPGFVSRDLPHIFTPLFRSEASRNRQTGGAGLGLAIARKVFRAHGGDLSATNRPEGGAELAGRLPRARAVATPGEEEIVLAALA